LEEKTSGLPAIKKRYITRVLGNKPLDFIEENFEYTLKLFEKSEEDKITQAKEQAERLKVSVDRPKSSIVQESKTTQQTEQPQQITGAFDYMSELSKF
jgi:glutamine synthetase type III